MKRVDIHTICNSCNKEFEVEQKYNQQIEVTTTLFQNCPHCKKRNDTWLSVKIKSDWTKIESEDDLPKNIMFIELISKNFNKEDSKSHWLHHYRPNDAKYIFERASYWKEIPFKAPSN